MFKESIDENSMLLKHRCHTNDDSFNITIKINEDNHNHKSKIPRQSPNKKY